MSAAHQTSAFAPPLSASGPNTSAAAVPNGTFLPGTKVQVGDHRVIIEKYLSEGGFAHVYVVRLPKPVEGKETAVLKRVAVPDKDTLATLRTEVETMKKLKGRRHIVTYIDSHASQLKGGGYEVFLLMEYCNGGGLIDFMNTRLQNRLTEPEVLKIFSDVSQGVACMHYLKPPLLHRDLKVENVLIAKSISSSIYKLCDFGSTAPPRPAATNAAEGRLIEEDVQKHTTLQYRSPEMVDVYRKQPIDEKSDIWALGVLLYKLCYCKTPFEEQGQMAILNASFKYPSYPSFSDKLKRLIAMMLREQAFQRPNIYEVVREVASIRGTDIPIKNIYAGRSESESRRNQQLPTPQSDVPTPPVIGAVRAPSPQEKATIPDVTPMRRGRPTKVGGDKVAKPSPSPLRPTEGDPFTALDSIAPPISNFSLDEVTSRFPALDDFSILHEKGNRFSFEQKAEATKAPKADIGQRVTNALADDAFAQIKMTAVPPSHYADARPSSRGSRATSRPVSGHIAQARQELRPPSEERPMSERPSMTSIGTGASPPPSPPLKPKSITNRPIWRVPDTGSQRSLSQPRKSDVDQTHLSTARSAANLRPSLLDHRSKSQTTLAEDRDPQRKSFEAGRPANASTTNESVQRSKSASHKSRPSSMQSSKPSILRRLSRDQGDEMPQETTRLISAPTGDAAEGDEAIKIDSNVDFLKAMEEEEASKRKEKRLSSGSKHIKRSSLPSVSLSGTKNLLAGRFGEAFRKFETNHGPERNMSSSPVQDPASLTPIAGSEATDGRSDDGKMEEVEDVSPEVRRELERRRLSEEERRVTDAAAAYKQRIAQGGGGGRTGPSSKAASIQTKVKSLLDESGRASPSPTKTASGYGKYTDQQQAPFQAQNSNHIAARKSSRQIPSIYTSGSQNFAKPDSRPSEPATFIPPELPKTKSAPPANNTLGMSGSSLQVRPQKLAGPPKPSPKPQTLRTGDRPPQFPSKPASLSVRQSVPPQQPSLPSSTQGQPLRPPASDGPADDDWETTFSKRYPDLSGLEMVETDIDQRDTSIGGTSSLNKEVGVRDV